MKSKKNKQIKARWIEILKQPHGPMRSSSGDGVEDGWDEGGGQRTKTADWHWANQNEERRQTPSEVQREFLLLLFAAAGQDQKAISGEAAQFSSAPDTFNYSA